MSERPITGMANPLELSISQAFEKERLSRLIETTSDTKLLKEIAITLLNGWMTQRAATTWVMHEAFGAAPKIDAAQFTPHPQETIDG